MPRKKQWIEDDFFNSDLNKLNKTPSPVPGDIPVFVGSI